MAFTRKIKDPDAVLDYKVDWTDWLATSGDTITLVEWIVPAGIDQPEDRENTNTDTTATIWLAGGELKKTYRIVSRITTVGGRVNDHTFELLIQSA